MVTGNVLSFGGGGKPLLVGYVWHRYGGTAYVTVGSTSSANRMYNSDEKYFEFDNGIFTCVKPGTYSLALFGRGGYNNNGTQIYMRYRIYVNSTIVKSVTGNSIGNAGFTDTATVTLAAGDTMYMQTANSSGSNSHDICMVIQNV